MMTMKRTYEDAMDILNEMFMRNPTQHIEEIRSELVAIAKEFSKPCYEVVSMQSFMTRMFASFGRIFTTLSIDKGKEKK